MGSGSTTEGVTPGDESEPVESWLREAAHVSRVSSPQLAPGQELLDGRFLLRSKLGEGGMGVVYEAIDRARGERVALKTLHKVNAAAVYRLKQEFRGLSEVVHPHLVRLHELFNDAERWYFTMELVDSQPVDRWLRPGGALDEARLRQALSQLASAVSAIHGARKLHRDLKPSNVMVDRGGRLVVLDFGLAVDPEAGGIGQTVADDSVSGTPAYMAPEQAAGRPATEASDWYAVGVMLFEALTGELPFSGRAGALMAAKQTEDAPSPSSVATGVPEDLDRLCASLLARDPSARAGADAVRAAVGEARADSLPPIGPAATQPPDLLGRERELSELHAAYRAARDGEKPVVVLLSGESGIGKSSLVERFLSELRESEPAVLLSGRCYERESVPFKAFDAMVDELSRHLRRLGRDADVLVPRDAWALRRLFPVLGRIEAFAAAPDKDAADVHELRRRGFAALGELFGRMRDRAPLVVHVDDLQWSDADSTLLMMHLLRQADAPRLLFVAGHRSEAMADNPALKPLYAQLPTDIRVDCRQLALGALPEQAALALAGAGGETLVREAGGNPFLLGELSRGLALDGQVRSLVESVQARVAALPPEPRRLLEVLAVCSRRTELGVVARASGIVEGGHAAFDALRAASLARASAVPGSVECYHDKIREAVIERLDDAARVAIHGAMADVLVGWPGADPEHLALHFARAGQPERAAPHAIAAADRAVAALAFERGADLYGMALEWGSHSPEAQQRLRVQRAEALDFAGLGAAAGEAYLAAAEGASPEEAPALEQRAASLFLYAGHMARGRALMQNALRRLGIRSPDSTPGVIAGYAYHKGLLKLRGLGFRERGPAAPASQTRLRALYEAAFNMMRSEQLYAAYFSARYARAALGSGDPVHAALAIGLETFVGSQMASGVEHLRQASDRALEIVERTGSFEALEGLLFGRAHLEWLAFDDLEEGLRFFDMDLALHREHVLPASSFQVAWLRSNRLLIQSAGYGRFSKAAAELPALIDEGWARNDLCITPFLCGGGHMMVRLAVEDLDAAQADLGRARRAWSASSYTLQENSMEGGHMQLWMYRGEIGRALEVGERAWDRLSSSPQRVVTYLRASIAYFFGVACAQSAARTGSRSERERLIDRARALARTIPPGRGAARGLRVSLEAAIEIAIGDAPSAVRRLRQALEEDVFGWFVIGRESARRGLGLLLGGEEGAALVAAADAWFRAGGTVDPARLAGTFGPIAPG